jgi:aspartyl-tRNA(Asn)/glutamyl-tRNA(Gln) amidotransferase subunit C
VNVSAVGRGTISPMISREEVEHVAALARLGLTAEEIDRMQTQLSRILEAIEQLRDVDTSQVGPTAQVIALENVMRDDLARPGLSREAALANAPEREGPFLRVPTILAEGR